MSRFSTCLSPLQELGCTFHHLLESLAPKIKGLTDPWRDKVGDYPLDLQLCAPTSPPQLTRVVLGTKSGTKSEICFTGYMCCDHETMIIDALKKQDADLQQIDFRCGEYELLPFDKR